MHRVRRCLQQFVVTTVNRVQILYHIMSIFPNIHLLIVPTPATPFPYHSFLRSLFCSLPHISPPSSPFPFTSSLAKFSLMQSKPDQLLLCMKTTKYDAKIRAHKLIARLIRVMHSSSQLSMTFSHSEIYQQLPANCTCLCKRTFVNSSVPLQNLPSNRQHLSCVACLENKREDNQNCSVLFTTVVHHDTHVNSSYIFACYV